jgi:predicted amidohydrolase
VTCYDLRFPLWSRYTPDEPYDVLVCVANWPESRQTAWEVLTRARAIENQCYMVAVNRVGDDQYSHYLGQSRVADVRGNVLCQCADHVVDAVTFDLDFTALQSARQRFRVLNDADKF